MQFRKAFRTVALAAAAFSTAGCNMLELPGTKTVWVKFADGVWAPVDDGLPLSEPFNSCNGFKAPPAFKCQFAPVEECKKKIISGLEEMFADFDMQFTQDYPVAEQFHVAVISSGGGAWCGTNVSGKGPSNCESTPFGVANIFNGGDDPSVATPGHEIGHGFGLTHTADQEDGMFWTATTPRFLNRNMPVDLAHVNNDFIDCHRTVQNSWQMLRNIIGPAPKRR